MKKLLIITLALSFCTMAYAADFTTITDASIKTFIEILPQYKAILQKMGNQYEEGSQLPVANQYTKEILSLFDKYGISMEEFSAFMQKVSMGFASMQMQKNGMGDQMDGLMGGLMNQMGDSISQDEINVLEKYEAPLQEVFESE